MRLRGILLSATLTTAVWWAAQPGGLGGTEGGPLTTPRPAAASGSPVALRTVEAGDSVWSIARSVRPEGDIRPLVDRLTRQRGGRPLQVGEELAVPLD